MVATMEHKHYFADIASCSSNFSANISDIEKPLCEREALSCSPNAQEVCERSTFLENVEEGDVEDVVVRSLSMSANVANAVKDEVKHLIRVNPLSVNMGHCDEGCNTEDPAAEVNEADLQATLPANETNDSAIAAHLNTCSHILPRKENIICGVVLSKWDDIMGPQTVHAWLQDLREHPGNVKSKANKVGDYKGTNAKYKLRPVKEHDNKPSTSSSAIKCGSFSCTHGNENESALSKAVKYVTCHTVNCASVNFSGGSTVSGTCDESTMFFAVPDLNMLALSVLFLIDLELSIPYSLAVIVDYKHYDYFLRVRSLCLHWLRRLASRLHILLVKSISSNSEFLVDKKINDWILDVCNMMILARTSGLEKISMECCEDILNHSLIERALTSHLQTFGCTLVMGTSSDEINAFIAFLALFLEDDEQFCSRVVLPSEKYSFHIGLHLQGLLLNEFGCCELPSVELAANPYPVTAVDLSRHNETNCVKQTPLYHHHLAQCCQVFQQEQDKLWKGNATDTPVTHESILHSVKESSFLVKTLLRELKLLPFNRWTSYIRLFKRRLNTLACTCISLSHSNMILNKDCRSVSPQIGRKVKTKSISLKKLIKKAMDLEEADFLIVLTAAEKLKPGLYSYIMEATSSHR